MANQNPQPAMLSHRFNITASAGPPVVPSNGATFTGTILTQQAYNELIYIYGVQFQALTADGAEVDLGGNPNDADWSISITSGPNAVPTNNFSGKYIFNREDKTLAFSSPIVVTHRQPLQVHVERKSNAALSGNLTVIVNLIGELLIMA